MVQFYFFYVTFSEITNLVEQDMVSYTTKVLKSFIIYIPTCKVNLHLHNAHEINFPEFHAFRHANDKNNLAFVSP